jgi:pyrroline-5-carboxylate reductase
MNSIHIAIIGAGNIGAAIAKGLVQSGHFPAEFITLTRRRVHLLEAMKEQGFVVEGDNCSAVRDADVIVLAVQPGQIDGVLAEIAPELVPGRHIVISVVTGVGTAHLRTQIGAHLRTQIGSEIAVIRAMPNTAIAVRESMTCLASSNAGSDALDVARSIFDAVGTTLVIAEENMIAATALGACGIAFFMRAIRAASQGGIEIGFHAEESLAIAAQTAKGAASLLLITGHHPEHEIDRVTTPRGCTIAGLNQMEHEGFSSALIRGITVSAEKAAGLYAGPEQ